MAGLGRIWNLYLLTMLTWNRRDSMPLSAAPRAPKGEQGWIFWSYKSLSGLPESGPYRIFVLVFNWNHFEMRCDRQQLCAIDNNYGTMWCDKQQLWKAVITGDMVTRHSIPIRGRGKSPEEGQRWNLAKT